jgi:TRAP-type mannitol/chloroaromatic compound transport system substrate-binding protein
MKRRDFVNNAAWAGTAGVLAACGNQSSDAAGQQACKTTEPIEWKMVTTWPRDFPGLGTGAARLAENIGRLSGGRLTVRLYAGNELVPPFEVFDAVSRGTAEMGHGAAYYWKGKIPAAQFFTGVPFGVGGHELNGWFYYGGGMALYREAYAPFGVIPFVVGNSGTQAGGWFNKEINSVEDLKGLKMRIPGIGGEVIQRAGATPVNIPGAELFTALQNGTIDAAEWVGPMNDLAFGLFRAARYYYYPGWQEPGTALESIVNQEAWAALPDDLQTIVEIACKAAVTDMYAEFEARNGQALKALIDEHEVELKRFPDDVLAQLKRLTTEVLEEIADTDPMTRRAWDSLRSYTEQIRPATAIGEQAVFNSR